MWPLSVKSAMKVVMPVLLFMLMDRTPLPGRSRLLWSRSCSVTLLHPAADDL